MLCVCILSRYILVNHVGPWITKNGYISSISIHCAYWATFFLFFKFDFLITSPLLIYFVIGSLYFLTPLKLSFILPMYLHLVMLFISLCELKQLYILLPFQLRRLLLVSLIGQICKWWVLSVVIQECLNFFIFQGKLC